MVYQFTITALVAEISMITLIAHQAIVKGMQFPELAKKYRGCTFAVVYGVGAICAVLPLAVQLSTPADDVAYMYTPSPNRLFCWLNNDCYAHTYFFTPLLFAAVIFTIVLLVRMLKTICLLFRHRSTPSTANVLVFT